jgi:hypothetical protein
MDLINLLSAVPLFGPVLPYAMAVGACCAGIATILPPPSMPGSPYGVAYQIVNFIGMNFGHARNATAPTAPAGAVRSGGAGAALAGAVLGLFGLSACTPAQLATAGRYAEVACTVDELAVAFGTPVLLAVAPSAAGAVAFDTAAIQPVVEAACAIPAGTIIK